MRLDRSHAAELHLFMHLNLDDAWETALLPTVDAREWGPRLRFSAPARLIEQFYAECRERIEAFTLYGSGDFHHLTALWLRRLSERIVVVSFDNHPDWDIRPPRWACGGWVNRALELPHVREVSVWGCGNFECWWPPQIFGNRAAERAGKLEVHPWADARPVSKQQRRGAILRSNWRAQFKRFVDELGSSAVYVTIDLDCLQPAEAVTNWENGKFTTEDVAWALGRLRSGTRVVGGDMCGAYSVPQYARRKQRFAAEFDHPKQPAVDQEHAREINTAALRRLWPILTDRYEHHAGSNQ
ncbi:MAG TPA: arginase family protein [Chthoniobacterales bacterium]|nr:arginase family protein [Chthoniobacterales bacterium]